MGFHETLKTIDSSIKIKSESIVLSALCIKIMGVE